MKTTPKFGEIMMDRARELVGKRKDADLILAMLQDLTERVSAMELARRGKSEPALESPSRRRPS